MRDLREQEKSTTVTSNVLWRLGERIGAQGVSFIVSIVLARLLSPEHYGIVSLVTVFNNILSVFVQSGLGSALIQRSDVDELDYSTVFCFNLGISILLYAGTFFFAPTLSRFYEQPEMTPVVRVLSLTLLMGGINAVQQARVSRRMEFKLFFKATLIGTIFSAFVGIGMAMAGLGVWALVGQILSNQLIDTILLWITIDWKPSFRFSVERFKPLYRFGWRVFASSLLDTLYKNLRSLLIGKIYTEKDLAYNNRGNHVPELIITNVNTSIQSVIFPAYTRCGGDRQRILSLMRKAVRLSSFLIFPCMVGIAMVAEPLVCVLYTQKWLPAVFYMQVGCFSYALWPLHTTNLQAILAVGRSDVYLRLEIIKKVVTVVALIICVQISLRALVWSAVPLGIFSLIVNAFPNKNLIGYDFQEQILDILPALIMSVVMGAGVFLLGMLPFSSMLVQLVAQVILGVLLYIGMACVSKNAEFKYVWNYAKGFLKKLFHR